jgi:hypothetical protein
MTSTEMPVFPLNTPLLPGCQMPLQIFEKRYLDMVSHCMRSQSLFCVALLRPGAERHEVITPDLTPALTALPFYDLGTSARIVDFSQRENGLLGITIQGEQRVTLSQARQEHSGLWQAVTEPRAEQYDADDHDDAQWSGFLQQLIRLAGLQSLSIAVETLTGEQIMNYLIMLLPLPAPLKQDLLATDSHRQRWQTLESALALISEQSGQRRPS